MNLFWLLLALVLVVAYFGSAGALILFPGRWLLWGDDRDGMGITLAVSGLVTGLAMVLLAGAVITGGVVLDGHNDGCYHLHTELVGKTLIQEYEPIFCPSSVQ